MIGIQLIIIFLMAILFLALAIMLEQIIIYLNIGFSYLSALCFLVLCFAMIDIQIPYQFVNETTGALETGAQTYISINNIPLMILFFGIFVIIFIYGNVNLLIEIGIITEKKGRR